MEAGSAQGRSTSVLLADDDLRFRSLVREVLEEDGYVVVGEAGTAVDAVALARLVRPDVVVMDLVIPEATSEQNAIEGDVVIDLVRLQDAGLRAAQRILEEAITDRVVLMSSIFDHEVELQAARLGIWYLEKVDGIEALEHAIRHSWAGHRPS